MAEPDRSLAHDLILAEFEYLGKAAFQNNEERARASQLFFVTFLTLVAAVYSSQLENARLEMVYRAFAILFGLLTCYGALTLLQLARFRQSWMDAAAAMNVMKDQVVAQDKTLAPYFAWRTLPRCFNWRSVGFLIAISVSLLSGVALGAAVMFWRLSVDPEKAPAPWGTAITGGLVASALLIVAFYWLPLRGHQAG